MIEKTIDKTERLIKWYRSADFVRFKREAKNNLLEILGFIIFVSIVASVLYGAAHVFAAFIMIAADVATACR